MREIEAVSLSHVKDLACRLINEGKMSMAVLGPVKEDDFKDIH